MGFLLFVWSVFTMVPVYLPGVLAKVSPVLKLLGGEFLMLLSKILCRRSRKTPSLF